MPEGVEVKISSELIGPLVIGKLVRKISTGSKSRYANSLPEGLDAFNNSFRDNQDGIIIVSEVKVTDVAVKGKFMYWTFNNGWYMMSTFGMSGQWSPTAGKHVCLQIDMLEPVIPSSASNVFFNDPRHFGTIKFVESYALLNLKLAALGWDPLSEDWNKWSSYITAQVRKSDKSIGELLMNQKLFAGVGNYIRAEALYASKLSPWRKGSKLSITEVNFLADSLVKVMKESYDHQGATIHTYKDAYGEEGEYSSCFKVYGLKTDPLGHSIKKETTPGGRSIHWCPEVQI